MPIPTGGAGTPSIAERRNAEINPEGAGATNHRLTVLESVSAPSSSPLTWSYSLQDREEASASGAKVPTLASNVTLNSEPIANAEPSLALPVFGLQVGAMAYEKNANALAESLLQKNFPAVVFKRETDRLYSSDLMTAPFPP